MNDIDWLLLLAVLGAALVTAGLITTWALWTRPIRRALGFHAWRYRNPYDRTCDVCGRHEVMYAWVWQPNGAPGWWEAHREGCGHTLCKKWRKP